MSEQRYDHVREAHTVTNSTFRKRLTVGIFAAAVFLGLAFLAINILDLSNTSWRIGIWLISGYIVLTAILINELDG